MRNKNTLILFTKTPIICRVKTRMWPNLSHRECLYLHRKLIKTILDQFKSRHDLKLVIYTTYNFSAYSNFPCNIKVKKQIGYDLGDRMYYAIQNELKHAQRVVLIGTDCLDLTTSYIYNAFERLKSQRDIVIGPADDGGYTLIGVKKNKPSLFRNIIWGSPTVLNATINIANKHGYQCSLLNQVFDIDRYSDLKRLHDKRALPTWAECLL